MTFSFVAAAIAIMPTPGGGSAQIRVPNVERWKPIVEHDRVVLSRIGAAVSGKVARYVSLAEMASSAGSAAITYQLSADRVHIAVVHGRGSATIHRQSGHTIAASGRLSGLRGRVLTKVTRKLRDRRPFLDVERTDFLVPTQWISGFFPAPGEGGVIDVPLNPKGIDLVEQIAYPADGEGLASTVRYPGAKVQSMGIGLEVIDVELTRWDRGSITLHALRYSIRLHNAGLKPVVVQPSQFRPVFLSVLAELGPWGKPLGRANTFGGGEYLIHSSEFPASIWWLPSCVVQPGKAADFRGILCPLGPSLRHMDKRLPIVFRYDGSEGKQEIVLFASK